MTYFPDVFATELTIFRIVWAVAWADGELSQAERDLLADFIDRYSGDEILNPLLREELEQAMARGVGDGHSWQDLVGQLTSQDDRELVLKLSYQIIRIAPRTGEELPINRDEKQAYRLLVELLALPEERVREIEWAADTELDTPPSIARLLRERFAALFGGAS